jgi:hypothetical protein
MLETTTDERREGRCDRCEREYCANWSADSPLWNAVVRGGCINGREEYRFLCPNCFMELAEDRGIVSMFAISGEALVPLQTVTPSGRVWNQKTRMFEGRKRCVTIERPSRRVTVQDRRHQP